MRQLNPIYTILLAYILASCNSPKPTAYFFISNTSDSKKLINIKVTIDTISVFNDTIKYSNIAPDLQYTPDLRLPKGKYIIRVFADSAKAFAEKQLNLDNDRWVFISYSYKPPIDTVEAQSLKNFGIDTTFLKEQIRGSPPTVIIHIMDKEPIHM